MDIISLEANQPGVPDQHCHIPACFQVVSLVFYVAIRAASVVGGLACQCLGTDFKPWSKFDDDQHDNIGIFCLFDLFGKEKQLNRVGKLFFFLMSMC